MKSKGMWLQIPQVNERDSQPSNHWCPNTQKLTPLNLTQHDCMALSSDASVITSATRSLSPPKNWVLITDDLSLIEWVCPCIINLKEQWTVKRYMRTKQLCSRQGVSIQLDTHLELHSRPKRKKKKLRAKNFDNNAYYK